MTAMRRDAPHRSVQRWCQDASAVTQESADAAPRVSWQELDSNAGSLFIRTQTRSAVQQSMSVAPPAVTIAFQRYLALREQRAILLEALLRSTEVKGLVDMQSKLVAATQQVKATAICAEIQAVNERLISCSSMFAICGPGDHPAASSRPPAAPASLDTCIAALLSDEGAAAVSLAPSANPAAESRPAAHRGWTVEDVTEEEDDVAHEKLSVNEPYVLIGPTEPAAALSPRASSS